MLKKYVLKMSNTLSTITYMKPSKSLSRSSTSEDDSSACSCDCDYEYNPIEVNRELFIENYLIARGESKMRSTSLSTADDAVKQTVRKNIRRKSFIEKRDGKIDRIKINRNHRFTDKSDSSDCAVSRHKIEIDIYRHGEDEFYENCDEKSRGCDFIEDQAPTFRKINNNLRTFQDVELSIFLSSYVYNLT